MIRKNDLSEVLFAFVIIAFGLFLVYSGIDLSIGKMSRIGPGFLPLCLGVVITGLGIGILFERQEERNFGPPNLRGLILISLAIGAFAALVETTGLFPATAALVVLTALANNHERIRPLTLIGTIAGLCIVGYLLFVVALQLPFRPFSPALFSWFTGTA
ncbi:MAG: tripartite tricarboxylate transporter TctB family protein [Alphaproteobacteria bacterium]|nr:tripartite tricarboxylate transporter TctB family protein [Alphaproteobacteria bacterium]